MEYIAITLLAIAAITCIIYFLANKAFGICLRPRSLILCAACALFISLVLPRIVVSFAGLAGTVGFLFVFAVIFAYFVAYYDDPRRTSAGTQNTGQEAVLASSESEPESPQPKAFPETHEPAGKAAPLDFMTILAEPADIRKVAIASKQNDRQEQTEAQSGDSRTKLGDPATDITVQQEPYIATPWIPVGDTKDKSYAAAYDDSTDNAVSDEPAIEAADTCGITATTAYDDCVAEVVDATEKSNPEAEDSAVVPEMLTEATEAAETPAITSSTANTEPVENDEPAEIAEAANSADAIDSAEAVDILEPLEIQKATDISEICDSEEAAIPAEPMVTIETEETAEFADTAETTDNLATSVTLDLAETIEVEATGEVAAATDDTTDTEITDMAAAEKAVKTADTVEVIENADGSDTTEPVDTGAIPATAEVTPEETLLDTESPFESSAADSGSSDTVDGADQSEASPEAFDEQLGETAPDAAVSVITAPEEEDAPMEDTFAEAVSPTLDDAPDSVNLDDLLDFAFTKKELQQPLLALEAFRKALKLYHESEAAPFIAIEIAALLKDRGSYDEAISVLTEGRGLPGLSNNSELDQQFIDTIAYLRIIKNTLLHKRIGFVPFSRIPADIMNEIDVEFREWRNLAQNL